jgi:hypothetical protein
MDGYNISGLITNRLGQKSFHIASENHIRIEFLNMEKKEKLGPLKYDGDIIITCYRGRFDLEGLDVEMSELIQAVIPVGESLEVTCKSEIGTIQIIWSPPFAKAALF